MRTPIQALSARTLSWVLAVLAPFAALPVLGAVLTVTPASGGTGASVKVNASGLNPSTNYVLEFVGNPATNIATLTASATGRIAVSQVLPPLPAGVGKMRLKTTGVIGGRLVVGYTAFTALGGLSFTPQGTTFHAGQSIRFTVAGLTAGTVTVLYENEAVTGPVTVSSGAYSGRFAIPTDRPASLPASARIRVINKVGRVVVNQHVCVECAFAVGIEAHR